MGIDGIPDHFFSTTAPFITMLSALTDRLFVAAQHLLPQHALSSLMYRLTRSESPFWTPKLIRLFTHWYGVDPGEAVENDAEKYRSFNAFFTRALKPGARPMPDDVRAVVSPADGTISQIGTIDGESIFQAKGKAFDLTALLGGDARRAAPFRGGRFATIYLSPKDYHRLHMPIGGRVKEMVYVPGRLFSVNEATTALVPGLFARNERVVTFFDTDSVPMALVLVGAIFVGSIETVWHGPITPQPAPRRLQLWDREVSGPILERGAEMGRFNMGSTVIALFGPGAIEWTETLKSGDSVRMGQSIGMRL